MVYLIAKLKTQPGSTEAIRKAVAPCLEATRKEPGCISYELFQNIEDPDSLVFVEKWETREHLAAHFETPHLIAWRDEGGKYFLDRTIEIIHPDHVEAL
ncbi:MAG: putative quinol monooxygenase [Roseibium sp.]